jgi:CRP-like cAMP-binding protein
MKLSILPPRTAGVEAAEEALLPGERTNIEGKAVSNRMLLALPDEEYHAVRPFLGFVSLPHHLSLHEPGQRIEFVYFPNNGLVSLVVPTREGKTVEVGVVGNEGVAGTAAAVGLPHSPHRAVVQIAGDGFRIQIDRLRSLLPSAPQLQFMVVRYAVILGIQAAQSAACNRLHGIEQRLARWLLMMQDRIHESSLRITHDFLASMLGTDRPSVSLAAGILQKKGTIEYTRDAVRILNRKRLEECACECYAVVQQFNGPLGV